MNVYIRANRQLPQSFGSIDGQMIYIAEVEPATRKQETFVYSMSSSPPTKPLKTSTLTLGSCGCGLQDIENRQLISSFLASVVAEGAVELWSENADEVSRNPETMEISAGRVAERDFKFVDGRTLVVMRI